LFSGSYEISPDEVSVIGRGGCWLVVANAESDGRPVPTAFIADTRYVYVVLGASPVSEYSVAVVPVLDATVPHVDPPSPDLSMLYPVMAEPPLLLGATQLRSICEKENAVAARLVGLDGTDSVAADAVLDGELDPTAFIADTRYVYVVPADSPVSECAVPALPVFATRTENAPPLADLSILYPVTGDPPSLDGAFQERLILEDETAEDVRPVGGCGTVEGGTSVE
jgi:hypothetical protein